MTNPTPPGQVPDALIYAELPKHAATGLGEEYESFDQNGKSMGKAYQNLVYYTEEQMRTFADATHAIRTRQDDAYDHGPQAETVEEAARDVGKWLNERPNRPLDLRHVAMLTNHAKRTAHVQNPAEIEHVAGDVSKNGAELNTNVYAELPPRYYLAGGVEKTWDQPQMCVFADATHALRAQQPAPATPQAREVEGWLTWFRTPSGGREPNYSHGAKKPTHGAELDAILTKYPVYAEPRPSPAAQAASSTVLKAIRDANMQLVRTGDNAFMLVPYKVATAQAAESVQDMQSVNDAVTIELPPLPDPDLRDVGTKPQDVKDFLNGYATEYARLALAARAPAESVGRDAILPALFREALAWGMTYGPEIPTHQWDQMRESMVNQYVGRANLQKGRQ